MHKIHLKISPDRLAKVLYSVLMLALFLSVIKSGYSYMYDIDELSHVQYVYLLLNNFTPYSSMSLTFTPFFYWFLTPVFKLFGFSFAAIQITRILMIILFTVRLVISFIFVRMTFGEVVAFIFLSLFLLDPFTVFSAMQIRPDNLMITLFTLGLLLFYLAVKKRNNRLIFLSGSVFSLSLLVLLKILPAVFIILLLFAVFCFLKKRLRSFLIFILGLAVPPVLFIIYAWRQNYLPQMLVQIILDRISFNAAILNPATVWFFYKPYNTFFYGLGGRPLTWYLAVILPFTSVLASLYLLYLLVRSKKINSGSFIKLVLIALIYSQILWLLRLRGIFLQYFLSVSYLFALFTAYLLSKLNRFILLACFLVLTVLSIKANLARSRASFDWTKNYYENVVWKVVPPGEKTFPNTLFRPLSYPLTLGSFIGDAPKKVLSRWPPIHYYLEKDRVKYLLVNSYDFIFIDPATVDYIRKNYLENPASQIWIRKN